MQRRRKGRCTSGDRRFTVVRVNGDPYDTHAGRSFEDAFNLANPDRGSLIEVFSVCAKDGGFARLPAAYEQGQLLRKFRHKGGR